MDEASRTKSELRQLRQQHEELLLSSREAASRADVANSQLMGELKLKGFELTRLQVSGSTISRRSQSSHTAQGALCWAFYTLVLPVHLNDNRNI
jgi:hypothetical protein